MRRLRPGTRKKDPDDRERCETGQVAQCGTALSRPPWLLGIAGWLLRNVVPGLLISALVMGVISGIGEYAVRTRTPFIKILWPSRFDPLYGFTFEPNALVQWTNHLDFWNSERANDQGFLDRPWPPGPEAEHACRVAFLGDSFVEAAQVPLPDRSHRLFERLVSKETPNLNVDTRAYGYSGMGQVNQLAFYDAAVSSYRPHVLVLVIASNDMANNSFLLESVRNGWDPLHPPRLFVRKDPNGETLSSLAIDPEWGQRQLPPGRKPETPGAVIQLHVWLQDHSYLYNRLLALAGIKWPEALSWWRGEPYYVDTYSRRIGHIVKRYPAFGPVFEGWRYPNDWDMDTMFYADRLPPVFQEALLYTGYAFDQFLERAGRDGFKLIALTTSGLSTGPSGAQASARYGNPVRARGQFDRIKQLLEVRGIPLVDQYDYIKGVGGTPPQASFPHDGHWSPQGHRWTAEALLAYFKANPELCAHRH